MKFKIIDVSTNSIKLQLIDDKLTLNNSLILNECKTFMTIYMNHEKISELGDIFDIESSK